MEREDDEKNPISTNNYNVHHFFLHTSSEKSYSGDIIAHPSPSLYPQETYIFINL